MKYVGLIFVVVFVTGQVLAQTINENDDQLLEPRAGYSDNLYNFLESLKVVLREGNETLGIPKLDPFEADLLQLQPDAELLKGDVKLAGIKVEGISDYQIDTVVMPVIPLRITIGLSWPRISATGLHKFSVVALEQELEAFGEGEFSVTLTDLSFHSVIALKLSGPVKIKSMDTKLSLGALSLSATGIFNHEETSTVLSDVISEKAPQLLQDYHLQITTALNEIVTEFVHEMLAGMDLKALKALLEKYK